MKKEYPEWRYCPYCGEKFEGDRIEKIKCPECGTKMTYISHVFWYCDKCKKVRG
jgi:ribosomal protein L37AE/L43A